MKVRNRSMVEFVQQVGAGEVTVPEQNDQADRAAARDFAALVRRQSKLVFRIAFSVLRNVHDSEDATQETFLKLYRSGRWRNLDDEAAFLARIAWRIALCRRPKTTVNLEQTEPVCPDKTPEELASASDSIDFIHRLIDALPRELREPLILSSVEELNSSQIGEILGLPDGTVRSRLQRARQILKGKPGATIGELT
jgi:RNA polymerase sigma-70 factor (ECF subfamily)